MSNGIPLERKCGRILLLAIISAIHIYNMVAIVYGHAAVGSYLQYTHTNNSMVILKLTLICAATVYKITISFC
jgi:hypothetical protein